MQLLYIFISVFVSNNNIKQLKKWVFYSVKWTKITSASEEKKKNDNNNVAEGKLTIY